MMSCDLAQVLTLKRLRRLQGCKVLGLGAKGRSKRRMLWGAIQNKEHGTELRDPNF